TVTTDNNGQFHLTGLPPAAYSVSVTKSGFQPEVAKNVVVTIGQTSSITFPMKVSTVSEQIEVTTEPPVVETEKGGQANVVSEQYIRELPINRRDYLTLRCWRPRFPIPPGWPPTRTTASSRRRRAASPFTEATAAATALPWMAAK